ncbi:MAG: carbohydrate binding domain-containing protein [Chitinispirillaceae bacterium]|nr:carbohydrate binding domain-containing protein [Chitinispirillaceae bacterium]
MDELKDVLDYATIWCNEISFIDGWHGAMVKYCKANGQTPVFYGYLIAKLSGLGDNDVGGQLDQQGGSWLRSNIDKVLEAYESYAQRIANIYGTAKPVIWLMEPDYYQYCNGWGNDISVVDAAKYMGQMISAIKKYLPNALFSLDISPWNNNQASYINSFNLELFSFMHTSGGRTEAGNDRIRFDNNNNVTWGQVNSASGLCIIADDGYGQGGGAQGHANDWDDLNNLKNRINNGVVAITQKDPKSGWGSNISSNKSSLSGVSTKCSYIKFDKKYSLTVTATSGGKVTKSPDATTYDSGATVTLTAVPNSGYKLKSWSGDASGTSPTVTVTMTDDKAVTATFVDVNAKTKFILTVASTGSGVVQAEPRQAEYDSGTTVTFKAYTVNGSTFNCWSGALSGTSQVSTLVMSGNMTVTASFSGTTISLTNLAENGDFSDGASGWTFGVYETAKAEGGVTDGKFKLSLQNAGTEEWHIQLMQEGIGLKKGVRYVFSFNASSASNTTIKATVGMGKDPYTAYLQKIVGLSSTDEVFEYTFTMSKDPTESDRIVFDAGKATASWEIDDISLTEYVQLDSITSAAKPRLLMTIPGLTPDQRVSLSWYDHAGRLLQHTSGDYGSLMRQKYIQRPGSFIAVLNVNGRKLVKRTIAIGK